MTEDERRAVLAGYEALKDITNAADGGGAYTATELLDGENGFTDAQAGLRAILVADGTVPPGEDA